MIKKVDCCIYCGEKMESITAKKRYCSAKCRLYFNREKKRGIIDAEVPQISHKIEKPVITTQKIEKVVESPKNYDFSNVSFFQISDFTDYPIENRPIDALKARKWDALKKESDQKIRNLWFEYKNNS